MASKWRILWLRFRGQNVVGHDKQGNIFVEEPSHIKGPHGRPRRNQIAVEHNNFFAADKIHPLWKEWLHFRSEKYPTEEEIEKYDTEKEERMKRIEEYEAREKDILIPKLKVLTPETVEGNDSVKQL